MARLGADMPFPTIDYGAKDWRAQSRKEARAMAKIRREHDVIEFPVADSSAVYVIASYSPPVLRWVPFCDQWKIPAAHIRGLTAKDLRRAAQIKSAVDALYARGAANRAAEGGQA